MPSRFGAWSCVLICGIVTALAASSLQSPVASGQDWRVLNGSAVAGLLIGTALGYLLAVFVWPWLGRVIGYARYVLSAAIILICVTAVVGANIAWERAPRYPVELIIEATGEKGPKAKGSEVWFLGVFQGDDINQVPGEVIADASWEPRDQRWVSYQKQPATLRWQSVIDNDVELRLTSHPWSGVATITWQGVPQQLDLYAENDPIRRVVLPLDRTRPEYRSLHIANVLQVGFRSLCLSLIMLLGCAAALCISELPEQAPARITIRSTQAVLSAALIAWYLWHIPTESERSLRIYHDAALYEPTRAFSELAEHHADRDFFKQHLPAGTVILASDYLSTYLPLLVDVHVMAIARNSPGIQANPQRRRDHARLLHARTPDDQRRALLNKYAIRYAVDRLATRRLPWLERFAAQQWEARGFVIFELDVQPEQE